MNTWYINTSGLGILINESQKGSVPQFLHLSGLPLISCIKIHANTYIWSILILIDALHHIEMTYLNQCMKCYSIHFGDLVLQISRTGYQKKKHSPSCELTVCFLVFKMSLWMYPEFISRTLARRTMMLYFLKLNFFILGA